MEMNMKNEMETGRRNYSKFRKSRGSWGSGLAACIWLPFTYGNLRTLAFVCDTFNAPTQLPESSQGA